MQLYLPLFSNLLFHTSIQYENIHFDKYHFCELISRDILSYSVSNGQSPSSPIQSSYVYAHYVDTFSISLQSLSNVDMYKNTIDYLRYVLFGTILSDYNIIIEESEKQLKFFIESLQDGQTVHQAFFNCLIHSRNSNNYYHRMNMFLQKDLLDKICKQPEKYKTEILSKLDQIRLFIVKNLSQMHLTICGNVEIVEGSWNILQEFINECKTKSQIEIEDRKIKENTTKNIPVVVPATIIGTEHEESG